ncbi:unnamed protein product [Orchesella dallaii]|uniref:Uncharacterized protein n=1 Tax=Orchesella dallaii TaxID=48710 RepID=A0ABP1S4U9_9HEXA
MDNASTQKVLNSNKRRASSASSTSSSSSSALRQDSPAKKKQHVRNNGSKSDSTGSVTTTPKLPGTSNCTLRRSSRQSLTPNIEQRTSSIPELVEVDDSAVSMPTFSDVDGNSTQRGEVQAPGAKRQRRTCRSTPSSVHDSDDESLMDFNFHEPTDNIFEKMRKDREKAANLLAKDGELLKAQNSWRDMQTRIADLEKKYETQRNKNKVLLAVCSKKQQQSDSVLNDKMKLKEENFALQVKIRELEFQIQKKDTELKIKNTNENSMKESMDKLQRESATKEAECHRLQIANAQIQMKLAEHQEEYQQNMLKKEEERRALQRKNEELKGEVETVKNQAEAFRVKFLETWKKGSGKTMHEMETLALSWGNGQK